MVFEILVDVTNRNKDQQVDIIY